MLVLLLGPSGVGKSTIANLLVSDFGWQPMFSWVTRPERFDELFKVSISTNAYHMLSCHGRWWSSVEQNGFRYGLLRTEVVQAISDPDQFYILDFGVSSRDQFFTGIRHLALYVTAESDAALKSRILRAGRGERLTGALKSRQDLDAWFEKVEPSGQVFRVSNPEGKASEAAKEIDFIARSWANKQ